MKLLVLFALVALASGYPGLLKVPKVYNAVITSNQNLSPSRAFPVIQPVIHRTAVGYVPPFYYSQVAPHVSGHDVVHLSQSTLELANEADVQAEPSSAAESSKSTEVKGKEETTSQSAEEDPNASKGKSEKQEPLSFYPNYKSLFYDPYFYAYNGINPHFLPGIYYVANQPYRTVDPIPASMPKNVLSGHLLPGYHEEKKQPAKVDKEKVPDVPPPPLPTAVSKSS